MELLRQFVDLFLHLDKHLAELIRNYGVWTYSILFLIVFCETGLVVLPLLPGDSLLFAAGTFAALGDLNPWLLVVLLISAALLGDNLNYWIGRKTGPRAFTGEAKFFKREYLERTRGYFARYGGRTIIMARFIPIVRTFTPFVAGVGEMPYFRFLGYSVTGAVLWVNLFVWIGYGFGNIPAVKERFTLVIFAIIGVSVLPIAIEATKGWLARRRETASSDSQSS
ncbi:MAG: DedA family protein [Gemmatimonadales bacterium]